jgi:hypothetical protein
MDFCLEHGCDVQSIDVISSPGFVQTKTSLQDATKEAVTHKLVLLRGSNQNVT